MQIVLESCHNQNILGTILHPASGADGGKGWERVPAGCWDCWSSLAGDAKGGRKVQVPPVGVQGSWESWALYWWMWETMVHLSSPRGEQSPVGIAGLVSDSPGGTGRCGQALQGSLGTCDI